MLYMHTHHRLSVHTHTPTCIYSLCDVKSPPQDGMADTEMSHNTRVVIATTLIN